MVYILSGLGALAVFVFYLIYNRKTKSDAKAETGSSLKLFGTVLFAALGCGYLIYGECDPVLFTYAMFWAVVYISGASCAHSALVGFPLMLYGLCGIYRAYVFLGGSRDAAEGELAVVTFLLGSLLLYFSRRKDKDLFLTAIQAAQLFIPFTLLIFTASSYRVGGDAIGLGSLRRISIPVCIILILFIILAIRRILMSRKTPAGADALISFGSLVCIMNFNGYSGCGQIISSDLHHPFENIIAFSQIFELGQKPFSEYIPVSGLYSVVQGAFLSLFGKGYYAYYYVTENLFYLAIAALIVFFALRQMKGSSVLLITLLFPLLRYNRIALILPVMLMLSWPALIKNRNRWLKAWFLSSLVQGLYYPLFGAAVCIAFMPMVLWQIVSYANAELKNDIKKPAFWLGWAVCILPALLCIPLLSGTLKHMLAMSSQTVFADGLSRFGQGVLPGFFEHIQSAGLRILLYDMFSFLIPVSVVWVSVILTMKLGGIGFEGRKLRIADPEAACISVAAGIAMLVSFSYTFVRMDVYDIYARNAGMIFAVAVLLAVTAQRYAGKGAARGIVLFFSVFLIAAVSGESIRGIGSDEKLSAAYTVPDGYMFVNDESIPRLGQVFMNADTYTKLQTRRENDGSLSESTGYLGLGDFGYYYLYDIRGGSVMEAMTIRGYGAAEETVELLKDTGTVVSGIDSFAYYYLYNWLLTSGEYSWSETERKFYPNVDGAEAAYLRNKTATYIKDGKDLGLTPSSWGLSMDSLSGIFTDPGVALSIVPEAGGMRIAFDRAVSGEDADFLYMEFDNSNGSTQNILIDHISDAVQEDTSAFATALMKKVHNPGSTLELAWQDDEGSPHNLSCDFGQGKLLIPLGSGAQWLLNEHEGVWVYAAKNGESTALPAIKDIRILKLREVGR